MERRDFLRVAGTLAAACFAPARSFAQQPLRFADMHAHLGLKQGNGMRQAMMAGGMLIVAEKMIPDGPFIRWSKERQTLEAVREAKSGQLRLSFDTQFGRTLDRMKAQDLVAVDSLAALDKVLTERIPAIALASEGADFLEEDLGYLEKVRSRGLVPGSKCITS